MIALIQRVSEASVTVQGTVIGAIGTGLLALVCAERGDSERAATALLNKLLKYRVFPDDSGRMKRSLQDVAGGLLIVPQFTLAADTQSGTRPSFTPAADPQTGRQLFDFFVTSARGAHADVACGEFGADMKVALVNDGPVTFWLRIPPDRGVDERA